MSSINKSLETSTDIDQKSSIKKLLKEKNLNPNLSQDLKYLLSLTLLPKMNKYKFNFQSLIIFLLKYMSKNNSDVFYDFFFQSCELGKIDYVKILLENKFDVNKQNELGETPLHIAVAKNDIELVKLFIEKEPRVDLVTKKDEFSVMNYAQICGNKNIIKLIENLNEKNSKKKIKLEIIDYIKQDMINLDEENNIDDISNFNNNNNNFDEIMNYTGEKISNNDMSISNISNNTNSNKNINNNKNSKKNSLIKKDSELSEDIIPKNIIKVNKYNNNKNILNISNNNNNNMIFSESLRYSLQNPSKIINLNELKYLNSPSKRIYNSIKSSYLQSLKTSHTISKEHELSPIFKNKISIIIDKKMRIRKFISEINLPKRHSETLIDNGFDDLDVLINQMKKGLALSYQNLKEINIDRPGDRAKILIHLEEISDNFNFIIDKDIIYSNQIPEEKVGSLYFFLSKINLEEYFHNFIENGYNSAELLFVQMASKNPVTEDILKNDLGINKIGHLQRILLSLNDEAKIYVDSLEKKNNNFDKNSSKFIDIEENQYLKSCEACFVF